MIKIIISFLLFFTISLAQKENNTVFLNEYEPTVDCLILEDENSIICKFETKRSLRDEDIVLQWINPEGIVSRQRNMLIPAGHGSIYDYRYVEGRVKGTWTFQVIFKDKKYSTIFEIK